MQQQALVPVYRSQFRFVVGDTRSYPAFSDELSFALVPSSEELGGWRCPTVKARMSAWSAAVTPPLTSSPDG